MDRANKLRFDAACEKIVRKERAKAGIGTLSEKTLHAVLKHYMEPDEDFHETPVNGYVADIYREGHIIEIQTRNFNVLRRKLDAFLPEFSVEIVYPIPATKWLSWIDPETGEVSDKRKSPKRGTPYDAFFELYKIKSYLTHPNLSIRLVLVDVEESRLLNGWSYDKKRGSVRHDRIPVGLVEEYVIEQIEDYRMFIPPELEDGFSVKDFSKATKMRKDRASTALHIMNYVGTVERIGKKGNAYIYEVPE